MFYNKMRQENTLNRSFSRAGFTLIETIIAIGILAIITTSFYFSYSNILDIFAASYLNLTALSVLDNEIETIRNMPYKDVGIEGGSPAGVILANKSLNYVSVPFVVITTVRNVDDPFDGVQGGTPDDLAPADYKLVEVEVTCPTCPRFIGAKATTTIAPVGLETVTDKGTLIVKAFDASGQPVSGANVSVINNSVVPSININDTTDINGVLELIDVEPSSVGYEIIVSKSGYSTDLTYAPGDVANPNPLRPHATVLEQEVTEASFVIDRTSTLSFRTQDNFCNGVASIDFLQTGQKLIGTNPDVVKYSISQITNLNGDRIISNLEFDTYDFQNQDAIYEVSGYSPLTPIAVDPNGSYSLTWLMEQKVPSSLVVTVQDDNNQNVNDAKVTLSKSGFTDEKYTKRKLLIHTDWSGGQYNSKSSNMETNNPVGELHIVQIGGKYASMSDEWLISNTIDYGTTNTNFYNLEFNYNQPAQTSFKIQIATNNDNSSWNFIGPDGTSNSFYNVSDTQIHSSHNGDRYMRYRVELRTDDESVTPSLQDVTVNFNSACIPDGQVYFSGLIQDTYTLTVEKTGYQIYVDASVIIDEDWENLMVTLSP